VIVTNATTGLLHEPSSTAYPEATRQPWPERSSLRRRSTPRGHSVAGGKLNGDTSATELRGGLGWDGGLQLSRSSGRTSTRWSTGPRFRCAAASRCSPLQMSRPPKVPPLTARNSGLDGRWVRSWRRGESRRLFWGGPELGHRSTPGRRRPEPRCRRPDDRLVTRTRRQLCLHDPFKHQRRDLCPSRSPESHPTAASR
jgi:hypothetical protein